MEIKLDRKKDYITKSDHKEQIPQIRNRPHKMTQRSKR